MSKFTIMKIQELQYLEVILILTFQSLYHFTGHFLLANLLLDTMKKTANESKKQGRIVIVSSEAHRFAYSEGIRFDKINDQSR